MTTKYDFSSISGLNSFWDGGAGAGGTGGGTFNTAGTNSLAEVNHNLDTLYQGLVGRNADSGGRKYWADAIQSGKTDYAGVANALKASTEYKDQQNELAINPGATHEDMDNLGSAYVSPFHWASGSAAAGWTPGQPLTPEIAEATKNSYSDQTNKNVGQVFDAIFAGTVTPPGMGFNNDKYNTLLGNYNTLQGQYTGLQGQLGNLQSAFDKYKTDMGNMWDNANWANHYTPMTGGVKTQNELPGWTPKTGGTTNFFGRGGTRGLTTGSLNLA